MEVVVLPTGSGQCSFEVNGSGELEGYEPLKAGMVLKHKKGSRRGEERKVVGCFQGKLYTHAEGEEEVVGMPFCDTRELVEEGGVEVSGMTDGASYLRSLAKKLEKDPSVPDYRWTAPTNSKPIFVVDLDEPRSDFWTSWLPGQCLTHTKGGQKGLIITYLGLSTGCALFDTLGWDIVALNISRRETSSMRLKNIPEDTATPVKLHVSLGVPSQSGGTSSNLALFVEKFGLVKIDPKPSETWKNVETAVEGSDLLPETTKEASKRLWAAGHYRRCG
eukprot:TRINITY_DN37354_c0_g1_i1.p1 TRINITY_DN37354_c0_g1~~TRINITY_DN37354_c0_g1_i1.p1  ORF type:complete len:276 (+),score=41.52 TRINITY_DN37354_c0_g1_i1:36-863(+)